MAFLSSYVPYVIVLRGNGWLVQEVQMPIDLLLSVTAGVLHLIAFAVYNRQMIAGASVPNTATWTLWTFLTVLNVSSYQAMSADWVKSILPGLSSLACILTFMFAVWKGKLSKLDLLDATVLAIGVISGFVWWYYQSAMYANLILQGAVALSFVPTLRGVWNDPSCEKALPWWIWSSAYIFLIAVVMIRWNNQYADLAYPTNGLVLHGLVAIFVLRKRQLRYT